MELRHLRYFVAVADELSFTHAANKLRLAQPSLTRQIHNLEEELGVRLFDRTKNPVSLTEEGKSFLVDARRLVALSVESMQSVQRASRSKSSQLNVGYLFRFDFNLLSTSLQTFYRTLPQLTVNLFEMSPAEQLRAISAREIDLGFVGVRPRSANGHAAVEWACVAHHNVVVALPAKHPFAKRSEIKIKDLQSLFFVAMAERTYPGSREWLTTLCQTAGFTPRILQDVEDETGLMTFVEEGLGVTIARAQIESLPHPNVVFRPLQKSVQAEHWIAWHSENRSKALVRYIEIIKAGAH